MWKLTGCICSIKGYASPVKHVFVASETQDIHIEVSVPWKNETEHGGNPTEENALLPLAARSAHSFRHISS